MGQKTTTSVKRARIDRDITKPEQTTIVYDKVGVCKIQLVDSKNPELGFYLFAKKFDNPLSNDRKDSIPYELKQDWTNISTIEADWDYTRTTCKYTFDFKGSTFETQTNWEHGETDIVSHQLYVMCIVGKHKGKGVCKRVRSKDGMYYLHARTYENEKWIPPIPWSTIQRTKTHVVMSDGKVFLKYKFDFPVNSGELLQMETQSNWVQALPKISKAHVYNKHTNTLYVKPLREKFSLFLI